MPTACASYTTNWLLKARWRWKKNGRTLPHLTIVKMSTEAQAQEAYRLASRRWAEYDGSRCMQVKELTFVREQKDTIWEDVAAVPLTGVVSPHTL